MPHTTSKELQATLPLLMKHKGRLRQSFYTHLFSCLPEAKALFTGDVGQQNRMFERSLTDIFFAAAHHGGLDAHIADFVMVHRKFDFTDRHFRACEQALVSMFADWAEDCALSPEIRSQWQHQARTLVARFEALYATDA